VTAKGTLESADNRDIVCRVRAGNKGFATSINWVIDDGTRVKPGQLLMILDDSALKDQEDSKSIEVKEKHAAKVKAEKDYEIAMKENQSAVMLAEIELDKLTGINVDQDLIPLAGVASMLASLSEKGSFKQQLDDLNGKISLIKSTLEQNRERAAWAERMVKMSYMSAAQAQAEKSRLDSSMEELRSKQVERDLLLSHDRRKQITDLTNKRDTARLKAEANEIQFRTEKETKTSIYEQARESLEDIKRQRKECRIVAPDDILEGSMVVYFKPESSRFSGNQQGLIEQGAQVKEGQKMLRIPNLDKMQVNTKVHEAMVGRIRGDIRVPTRLLEFTMAGMLVNIDPYARMLATRPDTLEEVRDVYRGRDRSFEYKKIADGQRTTIKVDAKAGAQFIGHVRSVAAVASQADWWSSDAKNYQTYVTIEGELMPDGKVQPLEGEHLKPDMTAEVTINVEAVPDPVLTAPIQAIIGGAEMGATREVFVKNGEGYERREIVLGLYNDKMVEIRSGLKEGDEIVVNPKVLLGDKDKTRTREAGEGKEKNGEKEHDKQFKNGDPSKQGGGYPGGGDPSKQGGGFPGGGDPTKGGGFPGGKKGFKGKGGGFPGGGPQGPIG
jgi:HlyD family secretion protein